MKVRILCLGLLMVGLCIPAITSEKVDTQDQLHKRITAELKNMEERKAQTQCPMSGKAVSGKDGYVFMGHEIKTCCAKCAAAVEKDPLQAILKLRSMGQEPQLAKGFSHQTTCPLSGKPAVKTTFGIKNNMLVSFCCSDCEAAFKKAPEKTLKAMLDKGQAPVILTLKQETCPISGGKLSGSTFVEHNGKKVGLCCEGCKSSFTANADKFMQELADSGVVLEKAG